MHPLNTNWVLWFHNPEDNDWSLESYVKVATINSFEIFWQLYNNLNKGNIENGMFFLMREGINPLWEDSKNVNGGCWSFKIFKKNIYDSWIDVSINLVNETLTKELDNSDTITGISLSPKKAFCIVKVWNNDKTKNSNSILSDNIINLNLKESLYKPHCDR